ncbi:MAG: branched-chain amino acid ABC transporter permease [Chloroflexi bacterium]|nr:branched-chain amino acid ABC transporter permease [Chloroflexota bacterium]
MSLARLASREAQRATIDPDKWSTRYFNYAALASFLRMIWVICQTSGVFGETAPDWTVDFENILGRALIAYGILGLIGLVGAIYIRTSSETNEPISNLITNYAGAVVFILIAERVSMVALENPLPFVTWMGLLRDGIIRGGVFALIALGYTLVYGILFMINFAHGEVMMLGAYGGWFALMFLVDNGSRTFEAGAAVLSLWAVPLFVGILFLPLENIMTRFGRQRHSGIQDPTQVFTLLSIPVRLLLGAAVGYGALVGLGVAAPELHLIVITVVGLLFVTIVGMVMSSLVAIVLERVAYRPLRKAPRLTPLISAIGASIFLQQVALRIFGPIGRTYRLGNPKLLNDPITFDLDLGRLGTVPISKVGVVITLTSLVLMALLYFIVLRTKFGRGMRAVAEDKDTAALMGANVDRIIVLTFVLGAALAGAAGVMLGFRGEQIRARFGFTYGLKAFTAAVLGGIGNIPGAMLGGFFLGLVEALGPTALGFDNAWQNAISFSLLVLVIIFRPTGILGEVTAEKKV